MLFIKCLKQDRQIKIPSTLGYSKERRRERDRRIGKDREGEREKETCRSPVALQRSFHFPTRPQDIIFFAAAPCLDLEALVACQAIAMNVSHCVQEILLHYLLLFAFCHAEAVDERELLFMCFLLIAFCCTCRQLKPKDKLALKVTRQVNGPNL